jgi:hypothetical protein
MHVKTVAGQSDGRGKSADTGSGNGNSFHFLTNLSAGRFVSLNVLFYPNNRLETTFFQKKQKKNRESIAFLFFTFIFAAHLIRKTQNEKDLFRYRCLRYVRFRSLFR